MLLLLLLRCWQRSAGARRRAFQLGSCTASSRIRSSAIRPAPPRPDNFSSTPYCCGRQRLIAEAELKRPFASLATRRISHHCKNCLRKEVSSGRYVLDLQERVIVLAVFDGVYFLANHVMYLVADTADGRGSRDERKHTECR